jgi:hypothetical protein
MAVDINMQTATLYFVKIFHKNEMFLTKLIKYDLVYV